LAEFLACQALLLFRFASLLTLARSTAARDKHGPQTYLLYLAIGSVTVMVDWQREQGRSMPTKFLRILLPNAL
jgi:hypothetical protein